MRIQVSLDNVGAAVDLLNQYAKDLERKAEEITRRIAEAGADEVTSIEGVQTSVDSIPHGHKMTATDEAIVFMEFGTGLKTESNAPYADKVSVPVYPGSWSEEHANTWQDWIDSGRDPELYPYNHAPKRGMYWAAQRMKREAIDIARQVFNE